MLTLVLHVLWLSPSHDMQVSEVMLNINFRMMGYIQRLIDVTTEEKFVLRIRRGHVLEDTLVGVNRGAFSPYKTIVVCK